MSYTPPKESPMPGYLGTTADQASIVHKLNELVDRVLALEAQPPVVNNVQTPAPDLRFVSMETHQAALDEVANLTRRLGEMGDWVGKRYEDAKAVVARMRQLADEYDRILNGQPKD